MNVAVAALIIVVVAVTGTCSVDVSQPITPAVFASDIAGKGFSTNYFKIQYPMNQYNTQNIIDLKARGFDNLRLRCNASIHTVTNVTIIREFLNNLVTVVDDCLAHNVTPIISWLNHKAEACAEESDYNDYFVWWRKVAKKLKYKNYRVAFNLFTENGVAFCEHLNTSDASLRANIDKYFRWSDKAIQVIRNAGGNNQNRTIILTAPGKKANSLVNINSSLYENDWNMMAEWHLYASGPTKRAGQRYWSGEGSEEDKQRVIDSINPAVAWTNATGIPTIQGAWMPHDNIDGDLNQTEIIAFGRYYAQKLREAGIPWCINVFNDYYDTTNSHWINEYQDFLNQSFNMSYVLDKIKEVY